MDLDKLKKQLWDIFGIVTAALFLFLIIAGFVGVGYVIYQSFRHHVDGVRVQPDEDAGKPGLKLTPQYQAPLPVEGSDFWIVPVSLEKKDGGERANEINKRHDSYLSEVKSSSFGYYSYGGPYYNFVFINKKTGESSLLLDRKAYIEEVYLPGKDYVKRGAETENKPAFMLLSIAFEDTNHDGKINGKDALPAFIVSLDGKKMTQITPGGTQLRRWNYDKETKMLFIEAAENLNGDKVFNWDDPSVMLSVNTADPQMGQKVIPEAIAEKVSAILK